MDELIEYIRDKYDLRTPEEKLERANKQINKEKNVMERDKIRLEMELEDSQKRMKKAAEKEDEWTLRREAEKTARVESKMTRLDERGDRIDNVTTMMANNRCAQLEMQCTLLSMEATASSITGITDLTYVNNVIGSYNKANDSIKLIRTELKEAMEGGSSEELEKEGKGMTDEERNRVEQLIKGEIKTVNQKFISSIPPVGGSKVIASSILGMSEREIAERNVETTRKMEEFMIK